MQRGEKGIEEEKERGGKESVERRKGNKLNEDKNKEKDEIHEPKMERIKKGYRKTLWRIEEVRNKNKGEKERG